MDLLRRAGDYETACRLVREGGCRLGHHKALKLRALTDAAQRNIRVALVSRSIAAADAEIAGMAPFADVESALRWLIAHIAFPAERGLVSEDAGFLSVTPS